MSAHSESGMSGSFDDGAQNLSRYVKYGEQIGIFTTGLYKRLDIGTSALKRRVNPTIASSTTRLKILRMDGPSEGFVCKDHKVAIFTMDDKLRLDVSDYSMQSEAAGTEINETTILKIRSATGFEFENRNVRYGDEIGIFSDFNSGCRLDLGRDSVKKEAVATRDTKDTSFYILPPDPIIQLTSFKGIVYDFPHAVITETQQKEVRCSGGINNTHEEEEIELHLVHAEQVKFSFSTLLPLLESFSPKTGKSTQQSSLSTGMVEVPFMTSDGLIYANKATMSGAMTSTSTTAATTAANTEHNEPMRVIYKEVGNYDYHRDFEVHVGAITLPAQHEAIVNLAVTTVQYEVPYLLLGQFRHLSGRIQKASIEGTCSCSNSYASGVSCVMHSITGSE